MVVARPRGAHLGTRPRDEMGSQAAAFAFATPVGAPRRGTTGGRRIARGGALGDGERRVSCAAASGSGATGPVGGGDVCSELLLSQERKHFRGCCP